MKQASVSGTSQLISEGSGLLRCHVEAEDFDCNQAVASRLVRAEYRPERANTNLMQDPEWSECGGWSECCRVVSGHSGEGQKNVTQIGRFSLRAANSAVTTDDR